MTRKAAYHVVAALLELLPVYTVITALVDQMEKEAAACESVCPQRSAQIRRFNRFLKLCLPEARKLHK